MSTNKETRSQKQANQHQAPNTLSMGRRNGFAFQCPMMSSDRKTDSEGLPDLAHLSIWRENTWRERRPIRQINRDLCIA
ncbi:hypothetical protein TNCV_4234411 [Trichonephila clavipes]|nr:hypothetical protein TNCV_4234411 [Trichonephila clavipes]